MPRSTQGFCAFKMFYRIPSDNLGKALLLQFCSEMIWPGLLCKTVTGLRFESWIPEFSPGDLGGTSVFSFQAAVMVPLRYSELAALEQKRCLYCQILPIKKSLVYHLAVICLSSSVLWCLFSASQSSDDFKVSIAQKLYSSLWRFYISSLSPKVVTMHH